MKKVTGSGRIERKGDGKYRLRVFLGYKLDGRKRERSKTIRVEGGTVSAQERNAKTALRDFIREVEESMELEERMAFSAFVEYWIEVWSEIEHSPLTRVYYKSMLKRSLKYFGKTYIDDIQPTDIIRFRQWLVSDQHTSKDLANRHVKVLKTLFEKAVEWKLTRYNPCIVVKPKRTAAQEHRVFNTDQIEDVIRLVSGYGFMHQLFVYLPLFCGLRREEVIALKWSDIDFNTCRLDINKAVIYAGAEFGIVEKAPKTESSCRYVDIPRFLLNILREFKDQDTELKRQMRIIGNQATYLFVNYNTGERIFPQTPSQWFDRLLQRSDLPKIGYHELRHTYTSLLYDNQMSRVRVSRSLGHRNVGITEQIYAHPIQDDTRPLANSLENQFGGFFIEEHTEES